VPLETERGYHLMIADPESMPRIPTADAVLGSSKATRDVIYAFGHGHVGMTAAPMTGKIVADLVIGRPASIDIAPFAPDRFH
jgi:D-amino-acid dehydrogenase